MRKIIFSALRMSPRWALYKIHAGLQKCRPAGLYTKYMLVYKNVAPLGLYTKYMRVYKNIAPLGLEYKNLFWSSAFQLQRSVILVEDI